MQGGDKKRKKKGKKNNFFLPPQQQKVENVIKIADQPSGLPSNQFSKYSCIAQLPLKYNFNIKSVLGSGFASTVYLGAKNNTNEMVCIKAIDLLTFGLSSPSISMIHHQIQCLKMFNSDFIVKLYDVYQSQTFCYLVMELCAGGDLYKMLKFSPGDLPTNFICTIIRQIAKGIDEIHQNKIIHRDLKTQNIFILKFPQNKQQEIKVKIGDLGFCISVNNIEKMKQEGKSVDNVGSPIYMSPEACNNKQYSFSSDIYALGIIWYELYHKKAPWQAKSEEELMQKKLKQGIEIWRSDIDEQIKNMITKCLSNDPKQRAKCSEIIELVTSHPSVVKVQS